MFYIYVLLTILAFVVGFWLLWQFWVLSSCWLEAQVSMAPVAAEELVLLRLRGRKIRKIVALRVRALKAGLEVSLMQIDLHNSAGGDANRVVDALIEAQKAGTTLSWDDACRADLDSHASYTESHL